jgi:hypothetical protein
LKIEVEFSADDQSRLKEALGKAADAVRVSALVARAGARESLAQATGQAVFSAVGDLRLFRIFCMVKEGMGLGEAEGLVAALFKVPSPTAKRWVNAAVARYRVEIDAAVRTTVTDLLEAASWNPEAEKWDVRMPSVFIRERIADTLEQLDLPDPVPAQRGSLWRFPNETYQALRRSFGLSPRAKP